MSRHSFRSQPSLQRSGGRAPTTLIGVGGLVALGLGFGAVVSTLQEHPPTTGQAYGVAALEPAAAEPAQAPPLAQPAAAAELAPPLLELPPAQLTVASAPLAAKAPAKPRAARAAKPPRAKPAAQPTPQETWEQQRQDYARAVETYDANERAEGYRWAQANRIRLNRYCRAAERRTPAFLQGCLSYVRSDGAGAAERAGAGAGAERAGEPG